MFQGFSDAAIDFMWGIRFNNEKAWFEAHKQEYLTYFYRPMQQLGQQLHRRKPQMRRSQRVGQAVEICPFFRPQHHQKHPVFFPCPTDTPFSGPLRPDTAQTPGHRAARCPVRGQPWGSSVHPETTSRQPENVPLSPREKNLFLSGFPTLQKNGNENVKMTYPWKKRKTVCLTRHLEINELLPCETDCPF